MKDRIEIAMSECATTGKTAFIPFTVIGYPNSSKSEEIIQSLIDGGATALELGLAFSDPMADGPLIEEAARKVVDSGFTTDDAFNLLSGIRVKNPEIPIVIMTYFNPVLALGIENFFQRMSEAGIDGITIVDLPVEEAGEVYDKAIKAGIRPIMLVSPLTGEARLEQILKYARGYVYLVSRVGITGLDESHDSRLRSIIDMIRKESELPVCIGFGISNPEQAQQMSDYGADGIVVGSKIISLANEALGLESADSLEAEDKSARKSLENFVRSMSDLPLTLSKAMS